MRAVCQRVSEARVRVDGEVVGEVAAGLCVLLGVARRDGTAEAERLAPKIARLRIVPDDEGRFDRSLIDRARERRAGHDRPLSGPNPGHE